MALRAAIFDMDGLLLESESLWRQAEQEASDELGLGFTEADFERTMGVRMRDVARIWFEDRPWVGPSPDEVADRVIDRVVELVADAEPLPGVESAIELVAAAGLRLALCSSSDDRLITAAVEALGLGDRFEVMHSAEHDQNGKPHPAPYLSTAEKLTVPPTSCLAFEDSVVGCRSAKRAGMVVIAVPGPAAGLDRFDFCDLVLRSLDAFDADALAAVGRLVDARRIANAGDRAEVEELGRDR